jgi:hypothetical protein
VPGATSPERAAQWLRSGFLDGVWSYTGGGRWGTHLGVPQAVGVTKTRHATVCSFPRARATTIGGSGGALTSVSSATAVVKLGEAPPGDESTWEAAQQRGDSATLNSGCGLVFALRGGGGGSRGKLF